MCIVFAKANGDTFLNLDSCKFCVKSIQTLQIPILKNKIHFTPILAWNNYDKSQIGLAFYSKPKLKNIDFVLLPMFGVGSKTISGIANFKYTHFLKNKTSFDLGIKFKRFSYLIFPENLTYNKIQPFIVFNIENKLHKHKKVIGFQSSLVFLDFLYKGKQSDFYYVNNLFFKYDLNKKKENFWFQLDLKQSDNFMSLSGDFNLKIAYNTKKKNAFHLRLFTGGFLFLKKTNPLVIPETPNAKFLLSSNNSPNLGSSKNAFVQYQNDYTFSNFYFDRNAQDPFFSRQINSKSDGGFKSITAVGNSNKYLLSLNMSTDIPMPLPVEPWLNVAMIEGAKNPSVCAEFGASLNLMNKFIQFHFPFVTTKNIANGGFVNRISFSLDLMKLDKLRKL